MRTSIAIVMAIVLSITYAAINPWAASAQQAPSNVTTQQPIALTPPPLPWLTIYPRDPSDQGFRLAPARILIGVNTPVDLEICIEQYEMETRCMTTGEILEYMSAVVLTPEGQ